MQREPLGDVAPDIEAEILHRRVIAVLVNATAHALLHGFADRPILAIHYVPEIHRIRRIEFGLGKLVRLKEEVTDDVGALGRAGIDARDARHRPRGVEPGG